MAKIKGSFAKTYDSFIKRPGLLPAGLLDLVRSLGAKTVADFACGTGNVAVGLALEGFDITGVDYSPDMLKVARSKALGHRAKIKFYLEDITGVKLGRQFDLILCLGNTIPHFTRKIDLGRLLANCTHHLRPGGHILFQQLNYDRMLKEGSGTFAIETGGDGIIRIKQSHFRGKRADFHLTIVDHTKIPPRISSNRVAIRPWTKAELSAALKQAGFTEILAIGSYSGEKFSLKSKDLIIMAELKV